MRQVIQLMQPPYRVGWLWRRLVDVNRRLVWLLPGLTIRKVANLVLAGLQFLFRHETMRAWPAIVKVDISPLCNLHCTVCVHARPSATSSDELKAQQFASGDKMSVAGFERIIREIAGKTMAVSLYYAGDPLVHPDLDEMCGIAHAAGVNSHISTNFSFRLSDQRLESLVTSGLTNLTVCIDGTTQDTYGRTRVGGDVELVIRNLHRVLEIRHKLGRTFPRIEVQYLKYQHNLHQLAEAKESFTRLGVDQFTELWGDLHNYTDLSPGRFHIRGAKRNRALPQCLWPHFAMTIKHDGNVVPCVNYRMGPQWSAVGERRTAGNVFETSVWQVWNSEDYRSMRRLVSRPSRIDSEAGLAETFCHGCPQVFDTDVERNLRRGQEYRWEQVYRFNERQHVERIDEHTA